MELSVQSVVQSAQQKSDFVLLTVKVTQSKQNLKCRQQPGVPRNRTRAPISMDLTPEQTKGQLIFRSALTVVYDSFFMAEG